jgi:single-strand DNA-binding protein
VNKVFLMGNLTRDPELKSTSSNQSIANFSVAVNEKWTDKSGEKKERVAFIDCEAWGKTAENVARFFTKGKPIIVEGRLKQDSWEDKATGAKRSKLLVTVDTFHFCGGDKGGGSASAPAQARNGGSDEIDAESIPF